MQKRNKFVILLAMAFILIMPVVFAQYLSGYSNFGFNPDLMSNFYYNNQSLVDFIVFFVVVAAVVRFGLARIQGEKEMPASKGIYLGMGLIAGFAGMLYFRKYGLSLIQIAPVVFFVMLFLFFACVYMAIGKHEKLSWGAGIFFFFLSLMALAFIPGYYGWLEQFSLVFFLFNMLLPIGIIAGILLFIVWLAKGININIGSSGDGGNTPTGNQRGTKWYELRTWGGRGAKTLDIRILIQPDKKRYNIGDSLTIAADVRKLGIPVAKKAGFRRAGTYICQWYIGNVLLREDEFKAQTIVFTIPPSIISQASQKIKISVIVVDTETPGSEGRASTEIIVVSMPTDLPKVTIKNPSSNLSLREGEVIPLKLEYELTPNMLPAGINEPIIGFGWFIAKGSQTISNKITLRDTGARLVGEGNNFNIRVGEGILQLPQGVYTLFVVALLRNGTNWLEWVSPENLPLFDRKTIEITARTGTSPSTSRSGSSSTLTPLIEIAKRLGTGRGNVQAIAVIKRNERVTPISAKVGEIFFLNPDVENGNMEDYDIEWTPPTGDRGVTRNTTILTLEFRTPGDNKEVICKFINNGNEIILKAIFNVSPNTVGSRTPPSSSGTDALLKIVKPTTREESMRNPLVVNYNTEIKFEVTCESGVNPKWALQPGHKPANRFSSDTLKELGEGKTARTIFGNKLLKPNYIHPGDYTIYAWDQIEGRYLLDLIWIRIIGSGEFKGKPPASPPSPDLIPPGTFDDTEPREPEKPAVTEKRIKIVEPSKRENTVKRPLQVTHNQTIPVKVNKLKDENNEIKKVGWTIRTAATGIAQNELDKLTYKEITGLDEATIKVTEPPGKYILVAVAMGEDNEGPFIINAFDFIILDVKPDLAEIKRIIESTWEDFIKWGKVQNYVSKTAKSFPPWNLYGKFLREEKSMTPAAFGIDSRTFNDITSKIRVEKTGESVRK